MPLKSYKVPNDQLMHDSYDDTIKKDVSLPIN